MRLLRASSIHLPAGGFGPADLARLLLLIVTIVVAGAGCGDEGGQGPLGATSDAAAGPDGGAEDGGAGADGVSSSDGGAIADGGGTGDGGATAAADAAGDGGATADAAAGGAVHDAAAGPVADGASAPADPGPSASPDAGPPALPCEGALCPPGIAPGLKLWLRGDVGVTCDGAGGRLTRWADLSGGGRHARVPDGSQGPLCGAQAGQLAGRPVVTFPALAGDEDKDYLEVDLGFLVGTSFTIAVVEKRKGSRSSSWMIGSRLAYPDSVRCSVPNLNVGGGLLLGYAMPTLIKASTWGMNCDLGVDGLPMPSEPRATVLTHRIGEGLALFVDGRKVAAGPAAPLSSIGTGLIGRGFARTPKATDSRYEGDLAEVIAYDRPLGDEERRALETYLQQAWGRGL